MTPELKVVPDLAALSRAAADEFSRCAREAIAARGRFTVALSGGSTPQPAHALIANDQNDQNDPARRLPWEAIHVFFGDERNVPSTDKDSNFRAANETLLSKIPIPPGNVHRILAELDANAAATQYQDELRKIFQPRAGEWPRFDLIMLGMGPDGHTASLFPGTGALEERSRWVVANWVEKLNTWRITFTFPLINNAAEVLFLVADEKKSGLLKEVLQGKPGVYPCQRVQPVNGRLLWFVDKATARLL